MPVELRWYLPQRVIYARYMGDVSQDEMYYLANNALNMLNEPPDSVPLIHSLYDFNDLERIPTRLKLVTDIVAPAYSHPRMGWIAAYGIQNNYVKYLAQMVGQVFRLRYRFFEHPQDAIQFLQMIDSTLPPLPPMPPR